MSAETGTPRIFLSYSWTTDEHVEWVIRLAERLVQDGVDVVLDQWDFKEGHDKYVFMERMVRDPSVHKVLAVCDKRYADRADGRAGGVGTESQIISREVYEKVDQEKFIPLIRQRDETGKEFVPVFFQNRKYIDFCMDDEFESSYERLVRNLFGRPERVKPALGKPPAHLLVESAPAVRPVGKFARLKDAVERGRPHTAVMLQEYLDVFLEGMEEFRVNTSPHEKVDFDEAIVQSIATFAPYRDSFVDMIFFVAGYLDTVDTYERVRGFLEGVAAYTRRSESVRSWSEASMDNYRFIAYELFLYCIAALIKSKKYAIAASFIEYVYIVTDTLGGTEFHEMGLHPFNEHIQSLDEMRNRRLQLNRVSVTADLIVERAKNRKIRVPDLVQADILLFVRSYFPNPGGATHWFPRCAGYAGMGTLELFGKSVSVDGLKPLKSLLQVKSHVDLSEKLDSMINTRGFSDMVNPNRAWRFSMPHCLNIERIQRAAERSAVANF